jgi:hypothetical protein
LVYLHISPFSHLPIIVSPLAFSNSLQHSPHLSPLPLPSTPNPFFIHQP